MVRCEKQAGLKKGPWTPEEDQKLKSYIETQGHSSWRALPKQAGLARCGKSCRLRWTNYLRPGIKRGNFSVEEENSIIQLHAVLGNRWSSIATHLPGRTDNEIKNHWNTRLRKRLLKMGIDPTTHCPWVQPPPSAQTIPSINTLLLSLLHTQGLPTTTTPVDPLALLKSPLFNSAPSATNHAVPASTSLCSSSLPAFPAIDPALIAAAEAHLVFDCLKLGSGDESRSSNSERQLNQLVTRLLLVKLLQQSSSNGPLATSSSPSFDSSKCPVHNLHVKVDQRMCNPSSVNHVLYNQNLHSMLAGTTSTYNIMPHELTATAAAKAPTSKYMNPNYSSLVNNSSSHNVEVQLPAMDVLSSSSYQQRLLQALPFLAESGIEPGADTSNAVEDVSSNQVCHASTHFNSSPSSSGSMPGQQQPPPWPATAGVHNHTQTPCGPLSNGMQPTTLMAWEELLMRGVDRDIAMASSSTVNKTSSSSTVSSASAHATATPDTFTNNVNAEEYWSNLLKTLKPQY
ncbi:hypothetical protein GOP47_0005798 [Adiantum capillus-veneris]|uniref:Uncharacterized protein n=1 Tax=Adiantum capillus-veneris TaxID=13818 RepID=A0A9D4ZLX6_ADICA|nr:hypothetical protein GOP47_0005798 [Adiantum capillus-veneris]